MLKLAELLHVLQVGRRTAAADASADDNLPAAEADYFGLEAAEEDDEAAVHVGGDAAAQEDDVHAAATGAIFKRIRFFQYLGKLLEFLFIVVFAPNLFFALFLPKPLAFCCWRPVPNHNTSQRSF